MTNKKLTQFWVTHRVASSWLRATDIETGHGVGIATADSF